MRLPIRSVFWGGSRDTHTPSPVLWDKTFGVKGSGQLMAGGGALWLGLKSSVSKIKPKEWWPSV